jgi:putative membrane protein
LHPLSPVLKGLRLLVLAVIAISWRGLEQLTFARWLLVVAGLMVVLLGYSAVAWRYTGYEVARRELRIYEGLISRRVRTVPLERLQSIEVVQPFQAKPFGLAELKLDVAGTQKAEAPLAYLPLDQARALRAQLLSLSTGGAPTQDEQPAELMFKADNNDIMVSQILTPPVLFTPLAIIYIVLQLAFNEDFGLFAILSMVTAVFATAFTPIMRMLNFWDFRLNRTDDGKLLVKHGLLNTRSQTVPARRIQSVTVTWPYLWRLKGWLRVTLAVAGQSSSAEEGRRTETDRLLPVATLATARDIVPLAIPGADPANLPFTTVPPRSRWIAPWRGKVLAAGLTEGFFGAVDGVLTRTLTMVPFERIQSVRITQGPLQRRLGLASVHADIAGGSPVTAAHRDLAQAYTWVDELERRAFHARSK